MRYYFVFLLVVFSFFSSCSDSPRVVEIELDNFSELDSVFVLHPTINTKTIAPIFVNNIASSIRSLDVRERKIAFIRSVLANILKNNENILAQRDSIISIGKRLYDNRVVSSEEKLWLENMFETFRCKSLKLDDLLMKVDVIPPSLVLAQTIVESGWGTSRFAIEGNSLFGEHFSNGAEGKHVAASESDIKLRAFDTIQEAVKSYSININRHRAYRKFRDKRYEIRAKSEELNSLVLVESLGSYSELGDEYISYIKSVINKNSLRELDNVHLEKSEVEYFVSIKE